ncbi:MAG: hypothetical protein Q9221_009019 [Calogaya cf. arnoldii]
MAIIKTTVAQSYNVSDAALNLATKAYEVRRTLAAVWKVNPTIAQPPSTESTFSLDMRNESHESVVGSDDERLLVDKVHFAPGGKYRSIVKLFIHYEFQKPGSWAMGTGWLIKPDVLVTAGHCSYDWGHKLGRATEVKAYIGYDGRQSEKDPNVQFRQVKTIVTTEGWVTTKGQKPFDVSFMQLQKPFTGITPIRFEDTPTEGNLTLGVVGYPGDLTDRVTGEKGAHMYEMFLPTQFNLSNQADTMLEYQIDTYGGNSGSPVLRHGDLVSIGTHVYGGLFNSASVIGKYGNPFQDYLSAFGLSIPNDGLNLIPVTENPTINAPLPSGYSSEKSGQKGQSRSSGLASTLAKPTRQAVSRPRINVAGQSNGFDEEGFIDVLKFAAAVPLSMGPIGFLAGVALNAAGAIIPKLAGAESTLDDGPASNEGAIERAILAEATLQALQSAQFDSDLEESIFGDMKDIVMKALPIVRKTAPYIMGPMMGPAFTIALDSLNDHQRKAGSGAEGFLQARKAEPLRIHVDYSSAIDQPAGREAEAFLAQLHYSLQHNMQESGLDGSDSEEGFFDIIKAGARLASRGVSAATKYGLPILLDLLKQQGAEALGDEQPSSGGKLLTADRLAQRALVADAALQAVMKMPPRQLQEEGFFDFVADAVTTIAHTALEFAPPIVQAIAPELEKSVGRLSGQESTMQQASAVQAALLGKKGKRNQLDAPGRGLSSRPSLQSLRGESMYGNGHRGRYEKV